MKEIADLNYIFITLLLVASIGASKMHSSWMRKKEQKEIRSES